MARAVIYIPPQVRPELTWRGSDDANQPHVFYQRRRQDEITDATAVASTLGGGGGGGALSPRRLVLVL